MKKLITVMATAILFTTATYAQPDITIDFGASACAADLEMRVYTFITGGVNGKSDWMPVPTSSTNYTYTDFSWDTDPGNPAVPNNWEFYEIEVRNCHPRSTGTTGPDCSRGNLNGVTVGSLGTDCFMYSDDCSACNTGQEISVNFNSGPTASADVEDL